MQPTAARVYDERAAAAEAWTLDLTKRTFRFLANDAMREDMNYPLGTVIIYARDTKKAAHFYSEHFGFETTGEVSEGLIELYPTKGGAGILIHQAAKSIKLGQVGLKLSFHVADVRAFASEAAKKGLKFGAIHEASGYQFANAKDPDKNSVSISSRSFRTARKP